jgi:hypothetical protein
MMRIGGAWSLPVAIFLLVDIAHIAVSLTYYVNGCMPPWDMLDLAAIQLKMYCNGLSIYLQHISVHDVPLVWYGGVILHTWLLGYIIQDLADRRRIMPYRCLHAFVPNYVLAVGPPMVFIVIPRWWLAEDGTWMALLADPIFDAAALYALGGLMWAMRIPESVWPLTREAACLDSLGWMHICIIAADLRLLSWLKAAPPPSVMEQTPGSMG